MHCTNSSEQLKLTLQTVKNRGRSVPLGYHTIIQGGPKKVSHYRESSLNRIKNRQPG